MAETFENVYRQVMLHAPLASPFLCRTWVQNAYNRLCDYDNWSWLRGESEFILNVSKSGTVSVTRSSATITGVTAGLFVAGDAGRQFRIGNGPPYSILSVDAGANTCVLDRVYGDTTSATATATILDAYVTCPEDFSRFIAVLDPANSWRLYTNVTEKEINKFDPGRTSTGTPYCLASRRISTVTATLDRPQYELWPYCTTARRYPYYYIQRPATLTDTDDFTGPLRQRTDILLLSALAEAAEWPGPAADKKNPYFNLNLAAAKRMQFERELLTLSKADQELYMTWWDTADWNSWDFAPLDSKFLQNHDFPMQPHFLTGSTVRY
jgi:hypothetical protein